MLRMKEGELDKGLATLRDASKANGKLIRGPESRVALDAQAVVHLATNVKNHRLFCPHATVEIG